MSSLTPKTPRVRVIVEIDGDDAVEIETVRARQPFKATRSDVVRVALRRGIATMLGDVGAPPALKVAS